MASFIGVDLADGVAEACAEGVLLSASFNGGVGFAQAVAKVLVEGVEAILLEGVPPDFSDLAGDCFPLFALLSGEETLHKAISQPQNSHFSSVAGYLSDRTMYSSSKIASQLPFYAQPEIGRAHV